MNIAILSIFSFPIGLAATNRILAYSKGVVDSGAHVDIFIPFPTERKSSNSKYGDSGNYQGVNYLYTSGRYRSRYKFIRGISIIFRIRKLKGLISSCWEIYKANKKKNYDCLIISTDSIIPLLIYGRLAKKMKSSSVFIFDEFPIPIRHKLKEKIPKWKQVAYKKVLKNISAYVSISEELKQYYNNFCPKQTHVLSVIVDVSRFKPLDKKPSKLSSDKYLCYMGNMELSKDDVDNIIKAFAIISDKYPLLNLFLFGSPSLSTKTYLNDLISSLGLENRAVLKGRVSSEKVPEILRNAYILVSSQPDTVRASGGFPTKLGEYLASGTPALLTAVGENDKYVKDDTHIFFSKPNDHHLYAQKLAYIIENYEYALSVALNGKELLLNNYSHYKKGQELLEFLSTIKD
jgi:glycosyltransferase involved in cell wall biosynthesis